MMTVKTYEEISSKYPINGITNVYWKVYLEYENCLTAEDLVIAQRTRPFGYFNKVEMHWYYCSIYSDCWYDHWIYDGDEWWLGKDSWDGTYPVYNEPEYGIKRDHRGNKYGVFKTEEEARNFAKEMISPEERLRF